MAVLNITDPLATLWNALIDALPGIAAAVVIVLIGYIVAWVLGYVVKEILLRTGFDKWLTKSKLNKALGGASLSVILGTLTKWFVFVIFLAPAARFLRLGDISDLLVNFVNWLPNVLVAVVLVLFGVIVADYAADRIRHKKIKGAELTADLVKWISIIFVFIIALGQLGVKVKFAENVFLLLIGGIVLALALAIGIAFGSALRDDAKGLVRRVSARV